MKSILRENLYYLKANGLLFLLQSQFHTDLSSLLNNVMLKHVHACLSMCCSILYSLRGVIHKWSVITALWEPSSGLLVKWGWCDALGQAWERAISQSPSSHQLSFFLSLGLDPCQSDCFLCWRLQKEQAEMAGSCRTAGEDTWSMVKAARPSGTERPVHAELQLADGVFCSMPSFAIYCTDLVYTTLTFFYFCINFDSFSYEMFLEDYCIFSVYLFLHNWTEIINDTHS